MVKGEGGGGGGVGWCFFFQAEDGIRDYDVTGVQTCALPIFQVITISEKHKAYAAEVDAALKAAGVRVKVDDSDATIGKKIRMHRKMRPAYMLILGEEETANSTVSVRARNGDQSNGVPLDDFIAGIFAEITNRSPELSLVPPQS